MARQSRAECPSTCRKSKIRYTEARRILSEAARKTNGGSDRIRNMMNQFNADIDSGKETARMLKQIKSNHADAKRMAGEEASKARGATNPIRRRHHEMRAAHFNTHVGNYEKHHANAKKHHDSGNYWKAHSEGSSAASPRHMRDIPSHVDIHNH